MENDIKIHCRHCQTRKNAKYITLFNCVVHCFRAFTLHFFQSPRQGCNKHFIDWLFPFFAILIVPIWYFRGFVLDCWLEGSTVSWHCSSCTCFEKVVGSEPGISVFDCIYFLSRSPEYTKKWQNCSKQDCSVQQNVFPTPIWWRKFFVFQSTDRRLKIYSG